MLLSKLHEQTLSVIWYFLEICFALVHIPQWQCPSCHVIFVYYFLPTRPINGQNLTTRFIPHRLHWVLPLILGLSNIKKDLLNPWQIKPCQVCPALLLSKFALYGHISKMTVQTRLIVYLKPFFFSFQINQEMVTTLSG